MSPASVRSTRVVVLAFATWTFAALGEPPAAPTPASDEAQVTQTMVAMYAALTNDDLEKFHAVVTPDYYAFDGGRRFTADELMALVKRVHAAGDVYVWRVTEPEVHVHGDLAWIAYVNRGSVVDAKGKKDASWLESAVLQKSAGVWKIRFFHATRVP
jgi:ketosteroid isomerase-like protein